LTSVEGRAVSLIRSYRRLWTATLTGIDEDVRAINRAWLHINLLLTALTLVTILVLGAV